MTHDIFDNPEARAWAQHALDDLVPKLRESAATVSIVPDEAGIDDIKFALELGLTIMLGKPLIVAVTPGRQVPESLARVADRIVELDFDRPADTAARIQAVVTELVGE